MLEIPADQRVLYFGRDRLLFRFLSHFHPSPILMDGVTWPTAEHYYQSQKSFDAAYRQAIHDAITPGHAKRLAMRPGSRKVSQQSWFRKHGVLPRPD